MDRGDERGGRRPPGRGWEMTDGPMEWCQAGWSDSWNRLSICDWPEKDGPVRRLSYHLHYQEEQLPAATGEKPHAMGSGWSGETKLDYWWAEGSVILRPLGVNGYLEICLLSEVFGRNRRDVFIQVLCERRCYFQGAATMNSHGRCCYLLWCFDRRQYLNTSH